MNLPEWVALPNVSDRTNALMRMNWELINKAASILSQPTIPPADVDQLQDILAETVDVERKLAQERGYWDEVRDAFADERMVG